MKFRAAGVAALLALLALLAAGGAAEAIPLVPLDRAELTMLVKGSIEMRPDGSVERIAMDQSKRLSRAVGQMIGAQVSQWRFEPLLVDGEPARARTNMQLRIVAQPKDDQHFDVRIQSASFSGGAEAREEKLGIRTRTGWGHW